MYRVRENFKNRADNKENRADKRKNRRCIAATIGLILAITVNIVAASIGHPLPGGVSNLRNNSYEKNYINWTWSNPSNIDPSFLYLSINIDGKHMIDASGEVQYYKATNFLPNTRHTIAIQTFDKRGHRSNGVLGTDSEWTALPLPTPTPIPTSVKPSPTPSPTPTPTKNTYYVSSDGNDTNSGTQSQPFATIYKGITAASDGDSVKVLPGIYYPTYSTRPIIDKTISLIGSGRNTIIDGSKITQYTDGWQEGLVEITGNGVYFGGFTVQNSITPDASNGAAGIVITSDNNIVEKNLIQYTFDSGIKLYGDSTNLAYNNTIRQNELYRDVWGGDPKAPNRQETLSISKADTFYIYYNYLHEMGLTPTGKVADGGEGIDAKDGVNNGNIHHNYVYKGMATGIYIDGYQKYATNMKVYDNIVERVARYAGQGKDSQGDGIDVTSEQSGTTNQINMHDNIVYNVGNGYAVCDYHDSGVPAGIISNVTLNLNLAHIDDGSVTDNGDIQVLNCGNAISNILIENNYAQKLYVDPTISGAVVLYKNDMNPTDIVSQFNSTYSYLKNDILSNVDNSFR